MHAALSEQLCDILLDLADCLNASPDPTDDIIDRKVALLSQAYRGAMTPFREAILASNSPEDAIARVRAIYRDWSPARVVDLVNEALQIAAAKGAVQAGPHA